MPISRTYSAILGRVGILARQLTPPQALILGFAGLILAGAVLLSLPAASRDGQSVGFLTALFTATSAVCVTGLVVVDTHDTYSLFGQIVTLVLLQAGGLGIMTLSTFALVALGRRVSLKGRLLIQEAMNQLTLEGMVRLVRNVIIATVLVEGAGALVLAIRFVPQFGLAKGLYYSTYHAVSAFCNAGFDLLGGFRSLTGYVKDPLVSLTIASLIIIGGLGFSVLVDIVQYRCTRHLHLHTKVVIATTAILILTGTLALLGLEYSNPATLGRLSFPDKLLAAYFQAVTPRTAGFSTINIGQMRPATLLLVIILMFIGASPGSTGGGIKTSTFATLLLAVRSVITGKADVEIFGRRLPMTAVVRALSVAMISLAIVLCGTMILAVTEGRSLTEVLFEVTSAFGTVGLSMGITPTLSSIGRIVIIMIMFAGRVGPLSIAVAVAQRQQANGVRFPEERVMIG
ncbi:MAG TPA: Trk family potassium uptake protein [Firmicutes bacterium]|nr:Trk family potassium uptake protein [Bacillota bacterium]